MGENRLKLRIEHEGNEMKMWTNLLNLSDISNLLNRETSQLMRHFAVELNVKTIEDEANDRFLLIGGHPLPLLQHFLHSFIQKFAMCRQCFSVDTVMDVEKKKIFITCMDCGRRNIVEKSYKLSGFMARNPSKMNKRKEKKEEKEEGDKNANILMTYDRDGVLYGIRFSEKEKKSLFECFKQQGTVLIDQRKEKKYENLPRMSLKDFVLEQQRLSKGTANPRDIRGGVLTMSAAKAPETGSRDQKTTVNTVRRGNGRGLRQKRG